MRLIKLFSVVQSLLAAMMLGALTGGGFISIVLVAALFGWVQVCPLVCAPPKPSARPPATSFGGT